MRILIQGGSPTAMTGLARVTRSIAGELHKAGHEVEVVGVNCRYLDQFRNDVPYLVYGNLKATGHEQGYELVKSLLNTGRYDRLLVINDVDIVDKFTKIVDNLEEGVPITTFIPVDTDYFTRNAVRWINSKWVEHVVVMSKQGAKLVKEGLKGVLGKKVSAHWLGVDTEVFNPLSDEVRNEVRKRFGLTEDMKFIVNVNRHHYRKDLATTIKAYMKLESFCADKTALYIHCKIHDMGGDLLQQTAGIMYAGKKCDLPVTNSPRILFDTSLNYENKIGIPDVKLNEIYNAADLVVSSSLGEGFGLSTVEAMASMTPLLVPNNTAFTELIGENEERGNFINPETANQTFDNAVIGSSKTNYTRFKQSVSQMASRIEEVLGTDQSEKVEKAYDFAQDLQWTKLGKYFVDLINEE